ncbi:MAG: HEAT repeat domain-containing protein [Planctomycetes bacterium]|nr:HEAT repeat domain-containing protein [Planctomycetota bacterium]
MGPFKDGWTKEEVDAVIEHGNPDELLYVPIVVSMDPPDCVWAEAICSRLSTHDNPAVRGNSVLGFGHLARTCSKLNRDIAYPIIVAALSDPDPDVRSQAQIAVDDTAHFLGWRFPEVEAN